MAVQPQLPPKKQSSFSLADVSRIWRLVRRYWWIVAVAAAIGYFTGVIYVYKQEPVYSASTQLLLRSNDQYYSSSVINDNNGYYGGVYKSFVDNSNEIRVIRSRDLVEKALSKLDFDVSYFLIGRLRITEVYSGVPFVVKIKTLVPTLYEQQIQFKIISAEKYRLNYTYEGKEYAEEGHFGSELLNQHMNIVVRRRNGITPRQLMSNAKAEYLIQPHRISTLAQSFLARMKVENPEYTNVMKISVEDVNTEKAIRFLDTLSAVYIDNSLNTRKEINKSTLFYIQRQMDEVENFLDNIEDSLQDFKQRYRVLDIDKEGDKYFTELTQHEAQKVRIDMDQRALDSLKAYVILSVNTSLKDSAFLPPAAYLLERDLFLNKSVSDLYENQIRLNTYRTTGTDSSRTIKLLKKEIDGEKKDLLTYIKLTQTALDNRKTSEDTAIQSYSSKIQELPVKQRGLLNIRRRQKVNEDMYLFLLQKKANAIIAKASIIPEIKIIEQPRSVGMVSPNGGRIKMSSMVIGIVVALIFIAIRILFFSRIETQDELRNQTHLPILGEIPQLEKSNAELNIAVEHSPKSPVAEAFRNIRTNLQYMAPGIQQKVIVVTSNSPGEGKTFCSLNIAASLAKAGKKVLLLELDLHKPRIHKGLGMQTPTQGITTYLIGRHEVQDGIEPSPIENLDVMLAGPLPPNPSELIMMPSMTTLIDYAKSKYDFVVIDTPPVGLISDALILSRLANIMFFVLNTRFAYKESIQNAHDISMLNDELHYGFILNGVKHRRRRYYYNRYGYGYGYGGYGYGGYGYGGGYGSYGSYGGYGGSSRRSSVMRKGSKDQNAKS